MLASRREQFFRATGPSDSLGAAVVEMITGQAALMPGAVSVSAGARCLSRHSLDRWSNRLAQHLRSLGVGTDVLVGLCLPRSLEMVVGALGILKAGGAYVPMDPSYPAERLALMLEDAQAPVLITTPSIGRGLPAGPWNVVNICAPEIEEYCADAPRVAISADDLAYVIYTSGSTGKPKGVEITHRGLRNLVSWHLQAFSVSPADRASHLAGLGFDAAVWELWPYLVAGARIHLADDVTRGSAELLRDWLLAENITISFVPTPLAERLIALEWPEKPPLRLLLTGGDTLRRYPPAELPFALVNNYGPTECTVVATSGIVRSGRRPDALPSIGRGIANTEVYLLDEHLHPVAPGAVGEICIGGAGVARGYRNRPDLTAERFIPNPFGVEPGSRVYRTGDLGRRRTDGEIDFLGRIDDQIKIRGYRIEPNEIVSALNRHPDIRESLVVAREDSAGDRSLVAYVVVESDAAATHSSLRDFLRSCLPEYMLPAAFVRIDSFPLTPHGKIDRTALPAPDPGNTLKDEAAAGLRTPTERQVGEILSDLLGLTEVGPDDNFFMLGGHSLLGAQLIARLRDAFGVEIGLQRLFEAPTVSALSAEVDRLARPGDARPGVALDARDWPPADTRECA
jgi:amino acid adenylation domain-containing protein